MLKIVTRFTIAKKSKMNNAIYNFREPKNETILSYGPGSYERKMLEEELNLQKNRIVDIPLIIGGQRDKDRKYAQNCNALRSWSCSGNLSYS